VSTSTILSLYSISSSASAVPCGALRLLLVFLVVCLGEPIFGGAIVGISCFFEWTSIGSLCALAYFLVFSLASRVFNFTISVVFPMFPLFIEDSLNVMNLLG